MSRVFAVHGSADFNERLGQVLDRLAADVRAAVGERLLALVLGGGYGRGEGGVQRRGEREEPYNDLDLVLVLKDRVGFSPAPLEGISARYAVELGIHVDFSRPLTEADIRDWPPYLMWHDLLGGHRVLDGPPDVLTRNAPEAVRQPPPVREATRLLLNRGAGLLWALRVERGAEEAPDDDFVRRNYYKCQLALGDAVLLAWGRHQVPYAGRDARLEVLAAEEPAVAALGLLPFYRDALRFKFSPSDFPSGAPGRPALEEAAWLWERVLVAVEKRRTGLSLASGADCAALRGVREPREHTPAGRVRNLARNLLLGRLSTRHPRERLYRELPGLLTVSSRSAPSWQARGARFLAAWKRFQ